MPSILTHIFLTLSILYLTTQSHPTIQSLPCDSSYSCQDLHGLGSLNTTCAITSSLHFTNHSCIFGAGNLQIAPQTKILCPQKGCSISINITGNLTVGSHSSITAGSIALNAANIALNAGSILNTTGLAGPAPDQTSGTPPCCSKSGGGHGGRGANCVESNFTEWGGDVYGWSSLSHPWNYGSDGGAGEDGEDSKGNGGGRVLMESENLLEVYGFVLAEGGEGGMNGGGGSGGSVIVQAFKLAGNGSISASGGNGWGGGGGGRISTQCYSISQDLDILVHGGKSYGCPENAGAAGSIYDRSLQTLKISNHNFSTRTETPLLGFPTTTLWSNVLIEANAKALVPLLWSRIQVTGQIKLIDGSSICFGLSENPISEFELVAEELLMSDSVIMVYGAFRLYVKMLLMWDSKLQIGGGGNDDVRVSTLEVRNLIVLKHNSVICSNADLGVYGQGLLNLSGSGDGIKAQRLFLSLFYNILVGPDSFLQAPLDDSESSLATKSSCESQTCPNELILPPDDCHVNSSLSFTLQICRVEDIIVSGLIRGSIIHIHRARTVTVNKYGMISASELGCKNGIGEGKTVKNGAGGGAGHGGRGGSGFYNGLLVDGGKTYGNADLPCELGSGSGGSDSEQVAGGGMIVIGSLKWPLSNLHLLGSLSSDGQSPSSSSSSSPPAVTPSSPPAVASTAGGPGGASGGTILLFLHYLLLERNSSLSVAGGMGGPRGGGGGGGGRIHFHWAGVATGEDYVQIASVNGSVSSSGGNGNGGGHKGEDGSITGKKCPKGLFGTFCLECPVGTYKNEVGSESSLCVACPLEALPYRADFVYVRGGATQPKCPYKCISQKYKMPKCYTPIEEIIYTFGGPLSFSILLSFFLILLALLISAIRIKMGKSGTDYSYRSKSRTGNDGHGSFPYLLSLAEVAGTSKEEETQSHVHRLYFMGPNTFREPWHLPYSPPDAIIGIVYEDAFNRFIDEINQVAAYEWWEGSIHSILSIVAYPCAWSWKQWCRRKKAKRLQEFVKTEYDHSCLKSCRSRALYKGMKVGSTPDLTVAYIDFFLGGDEKRADTQSTAQKRFPMCVIFGGDGSYMSPFCLHSDPLFSNLIRQYVSTAIWNRFTSGLNAQLRSVNRTKIKRQLARVVSWAASHGNPRLDQYGVRAELAWFQPTASGYFQLGLVLSVNERLFSPTYLSSSEPTRRSISSTISVKSPRRQVNPPQSQSQSQSQPSGSSSSFSSRKRQTGGVHGGLITGDDALNSLRFKRDSLFPFSLLLRNTNPIGFEETVQLVICVILLGDFAITLLILVQFYWISVGAFLVILLVPPFSLLSPFLAGLNTIFSRGLKRSSLSRIYALWNATSLVNIIVAIICGLIFCTLPSTQMLTVLNNANFRRDENEWWVLPIILILVKILQEGLVNLHIANVEIQDLSLFSPNPDKFWAM